MSFLRHVALACAIVAFPAFAHDYKVGNLHIDHPWARATPSGSQNGAAYLTINNQGEADSLLSAAATVSKTVELHTHLNEQGVMRMRQVPEITVPAQGKAELKPGGYHIMLIGLQQPLKQGEKFPLTLKFAKAGEVKVEVAVEGLGAPQPKMMHGHQH
ncbi:copper chaperone PCu(A)C [Aquaspirillum serpens]|uniref:copper chaperone PCu(A)C n=1 Tax=Aquaspirillum serpens TaxID=190 RepID=UPI000483BACD|nr:copper chaperone PCu(A)C [Aquaspirillum serpens]